MQERENGIIKTWRHDKGYGFLEREGCPDLFFHISALEPGAGELIQQGMHAEFVAGVDDRNGRPKATRVELLQSERVER